ncbi:MAG TPA: M6 family metalloprotease domain-containing protein, partial [Longimicrobiales bacterium]|nr:M6 family metalloprotease domain-containing protein [Longimicrobiales bacterium]
MRTHPVAAGAPRGRRGLRAREARALAGHRRPAWLAVWLLAALLPASVSAQDVEMLGRRYGTTPPAGYFQERARNPEAFRFGRGRAARMRIQAENRAALPPDARLGVLAALGPREPPVEGSFAIPVVMGLFSTTEAAPFAAAEILDAYFGDGNATVSAYYAEVSGGRVSLSGDVFGWVRTSMSPGQVTRNESGLVCCGIGDFIREILDGLPSVDWGLYDNDGPDGVPNSGDDDGFVDALAVLHPTWGAECDENPQRIWSHKWALSDASSSQAPYDTGQPSASGGNILVDDYFVQGVLACRDASRLNEIGVFVHETGHAFGLPDLYDTEQANGEHHGAGTWDLMASGTWGCDDQSPDLPCHMGAWSKAVLGWVEVDTLPADTDLGTLVLEPVETSGVVYQVSAGDGSNDRFLIENRQPIDGTFDANLPAGGLLIWQIDDDLVEGAWAANQVNASLPMGVWLRQADGLDELGQSSGDRGDAGDPFPGATGNSAFHAGSNPASLTSLGTASGLTVLDIAPVAGGAVTFHALTRFNRLTLTASGVDDSEPLFRVDDDAVSAAPDNWVLVAPFETRTVVAAGGAVFEPGQRRPFLRWSDNPAAPRTREVTGGLADLSLVAEYDAQGLEYELRIDLDAGSSSAVPGVITTAPEREELWFAPGTEVTVGISENPGFDFLAWTGDLEGAPNPATLVMDAPVFAGASFDLVYEVVDADVPFVATVQGSAQLTVANATPPVTWRRIAG